VRSPAVTLLMAFAALGAGVAAVVVVIVLARAVL
jgi:hypothetical protein